MSARLPRLVMPGAWYLEGACLGMDPEIFFPGPDDVEAVERAKRVCNGTGSRPPCPVRAECLEYALANSIKEGVWGGWGEYTRKQMRAQRAEERRRRPATRPPGRRDSTRPAHPADRPPPTAGGPAAA